MTELLNEDNKEKGIENTSLKDLNIDSIRDQHFDVTIVGGGIHGAGVAQAAAAAGYSTLLLEKTGWAAGTSSKSSKLIHGGLRYLQGGHFKLVRESLHERELLLRLAPHLVEKNEFLVPVYKRSHYRPWQLWCGLSLYYALTGFTNNGRFRILSKSQRSTLNGLDTQNLQSVFQYIDAQTDDAELTEAVALSAQQLGAQLACPVTLLSASRNNDNKTNLKLNSNGENFSASTSILINCAGPWVNDVAKTLSPAVPTLPIELVQGTHLVLSAPIIDRYYYLESPSDQRAVFLLPWKGKMLLGTTETAFTGDPSQARALDSEEAYLLDILKHYFPDAKPVVEQRMAGLRVLPKASGNPFRRSREVVLSRNLGPTSHYIAVYGGKLTGYRATAEKVVQLAQKTLGKRQRIADTTDLVLPEIN